MKVAAVIGATGFVGSHIVYHLVRCGYHVRCASRDPKKAAWLKNINEDASGKILLYKLALKTTGPEDDDMLNDLVQGCSALFFAAGFEKQEPATIDFMVNNALACISAAKKNNVDSVVLTSSGGSTNAPGLTNETPKQELVHWSDSEAQIAAGKFSPAAKTLMDLRSLEAVGRDKANNIVDKTLSESSPRLCIINPNLILGPQLQPGPISGNSLPWIGRIIRGQAMADIIPNDSMSIIDVRDLAALQVAAAEQGNASGRYFGVDRSYPWEDILNALKEAYPSYQIPPRFKGPSSIPTQFDHSRKESLGVKLRPLHETMENLVSFMISRGVIHTP